MTHVVIPIEGMTCGGCVKSVERALGHQTGVRSAKASLEQKNVAIEFDEAVVNRQELQDAITKAGFVVPA